MCLKGLNIPKPKPVQKAPDRSALDMEATRKRLDTQQGVYGNIFTSALGDTANYGKNTVAQIRPAAA